MIILYEDKIAYGKIKNFFYFFLDFLVYFLYKIIRGDL